MKNLLKLNEDQTMAWQNMRDVFGVKEETQYLNKLFDYIQSEMFEQPICHVDEKQDVPSKLTVNQFIKYLEEYNLTKTANVVSDFFLENPWIENAIEFINAGNMTYEYDMIYFDAIPKYTEEYQKFSFMLNINDRYSYLRVEGYDGQYLEASSNTLKLNW